MTEEELVMLTAKTADDKRADHIVVLNMQGISLITDYFMI